MKVLVTGATGFVGTALRRQLIAQGFDVRAFVRPESTSRIRNDEGVEIVTGNVLDSTACMRAVDGVDAVVHLVGIRREIPRSGTTYETMHTAATFSMADSARREGVEKFIYLSGLGARKNAVSRYHITKWESEGVVRRTGMRWTIIRPSVIFGPGDEFHPLLVDLVRRPVVPIVDGGRSLLQPVSLQNVVDVISLSLTHTEAQGRVYEMGGADRVPFVDIVARVARHLDVWPNYANVSSTLMKPMVKMLQRCRSFPLTYDELLMILEDNVCDTSPVVDAFGITPDPYLAHLDEILGRVVRKAA